MSTDTGDRPTTRAAKTAEKVGAPAPAAPTEGPKVIITSTYSGRTLFVCVGAGGTGARVVPPLTQIMRPNDALAIIDHDIVEDRNLHRQHFTSRDIGQYKALVLADRYRRTGIHVQAFATKFDEGSSLAEIVNSLSNNQRQPFRAVVFIGCSDNAAARRAMNFWAVKHEQLGTSNGAWIDGGNETRGGQVLMTLRRWPLKVIAGSVVIPSSSLHVNGIGAMPQLLKDEVVPTASCGDMIDLQTVQANMMSASGILNQIAILLSGVPTSNAGVFFSTLNSMSPIRLDSFSENIVQPEKTYAIEA